MDGFLPLALGGVLTLVLALVAFLYVRVKNMPIPEEEHDAPPPPERHDDLYLARVGNMRVRVSALTHIGARERQEDAFGLSPADTVEESGLCAVVCDGMGGMENGAMASRLAVRSAMPAYLSSTLPPEQALCLAAETANRDVHRTASAMGLDGRMGTTMVMAAIRDNGLYFISVGDSRLFLYRGGTLKQLNRDHIFFADLLERVNDGLMSMAEANSHPEREHLTSYIGLSEIERADLGGPIHLVPGDRVLLCSDGLYKALPEERIAGILGADGAQTHEILLQAIIRERFAKQDNIAIVLLDCLDLEGQG